MVCVIQGIISGHVILKLKKKSGKIQLKFMYGAGVRSMMKICMNTIDGYDGQCVDCDVSGSTLEGTLIVKKDDDDQIPQRKSS